MFQGVTRGRRGEETGEVSVRGTGGLRTGRGRRYHGLIYLLRVLIRRERLQQVGEWDEKSERSQRESA